MANDEEAAQILIMISQSRPPPSTDTKKMTVGASSSSWTTDPTPEWLLKLMAQKNGAELKKIIEKELTATDVSRSNDRLSMPFSKIIDLEFLSPAEQRIIEEDEGKKDKTGVDARLVVKLVDSDVLKEFDVNLRKWKMPKESRSPTFIYNLIRWKQVLVEGEGSCGLKKSDKIRLWSFHSDGKLYFALAALSPPPPSDSGDAKPEEIGSASAIYDKANDNLPRK